MARVLFVSRGRWIGVLTFGALMAGPPAASGQNDVEFSLTPRLGLVSFGDELYATSAWESGAFYSSSGSLRPAPSYGVALEAASPRAGLRLRASADYSHAVQLDMRFVESRCAEVCSNLPIQSHTPGGASEFLVLGIDAVLPLKLALGPVESYIAAGVGWTRYSFAVPSLTFDLEQGWALPTSGTASAFRLGGGFDVPVRGTVLTVGLMDSISRYWGNTQHQVMGSVGVKLGR